tara:strand:- start:2867 stop:3298 length:432 start_codon:yes stop_codon:yes gene_type:complete
MTLMTYTPRISIFDEFNKIFNGINTYESTKTYNSIWEPAYDIHEDDKNYYLSFDLPGIGKDSIDISISNDMLIVSGSRKSESNHNDNYSRFNNIQYGNFQKSFNLPENVNQDKISAKMKDGVLNMAIKKSKNISDDIKKITIK